MTGEKIDIIDIAGESTSLQTALMEVFGVDNKPHGDRGTSDDSDGKNNTVGEMEDESPLGLAGIETSTEEKKQNLEDERQTLFFFQNEDLTESNSFRPEDPNDRDKSFPVKAFGQIDSIFVQSPSNNFSVYLEIDGDRIIESKSWSDLDAISQELAHISAYQRQSGEFVVSVSDYVFNDEIDFSIRPNEEITFDFIRVELMIDDFNRE